MTFFISLILGIGVIFMLVQGVRAGENRRLAKSYLWACLGAEILHISLTIFFAVNIRTFSFIQTIVIVGIFLGETITIMCIWFDEKEKYDEISFKNILLKGFQKKEDLDYQKFTAKKFASSKNLQYVSNVKFQELIKSPNVKRVISEENKYIWFWPLYDEECEMNNLEWYGEFMADRSIIQYSRILTNQYSFSCITNLKEILVQIIEFYEDSLDDEWFINPYGFVIELEEKVVPEYTGKARLIITDKTIINESVEYDQKFAYKKKLLKQFLEDFIGANFVKNISEDAELEGKISRLKVWAKDKKML